MPRDCVANLDTITTIALHALAERITTLSPEKVTAVEAALRFALGMDS